MGASNTGRAEQGDQTFLNHLKSLEKKEWKNMGDPEILCLSKTKKEGDYYDGD